MEHIVCLLHFSSVVTLAFWSWCQQSHQHPFSIGQNMFFISASFLTLQKVQDVFHFSFLSSPAITQGRGGGLLALKPMLLIPDDTAATPSAVSSLRSGNLSRKRRREKQSWWGLGRRLATRLKRGTENGSCQEMWRWGRAGEVRPPPTDALFCLKTLSHELGTPGHQIKCRQASLSSWVRRYVCAWTQVWLLR